MRRLPRTLRVAFAGLERRLSKNYCVKKLSEKAKNHPAG
jgi:hypothetical protein